MRATPLMLAIALGLGLPAGLAGAAAPAADSVQRDEALQLWIVKFDEPPAASFRGFDARDARRPKLAATSPAATGARKYDSRSADARAYVDYLGELREARLAEASRRIGRPLSPRHVYSHAMNGVALELSPAEAARIATVPGVMGVRPDFVRYTQTDKGPQWINADEVWSGAATGTARRGEGVIVGVIDTGINRAHVAFSGTGINNPLGGFRGYCVATPGACNTKLIGLWDFTNGGSGNTADPVDDDGHGTHTAATSAGNAFSLYSGVAPRANIIVYKACPGDTCIGTALIASIDQAVSDGVDVINYSIGGGQGDPWARVDTAGYDDAEAFLAAREAGIVAAVAAGNDGPDQGTLTNPGNAPWVLGVAAATHDRGGINNADRLATFSGRGPVVPFGVIKPDVTAPGVQIISAGITGTTSVATKSGTSMATPHVAGAAALIKSTNPAYTADQVISALVLTARDSVKLGPVVIANAHEQGAGMIDVAKAVRAGLYTEVPANGFRAAGADVYTGNADELNLPSLGHGACFRTCVFTRTFRQMPGAPVANYSVQASIAAGASITPGTASFDSSAAGTSVTFTVNVDSPTLAGKWVYGEVTLVNNAGDGRPDLKLPVAVYASPFSSAAAEATLTEVQRDVTTERGFFDIAVNGLVPLADARFVTTDLVAPETTVENITADPTNTEIYDNAASNYVRIVTVPANGTAATLNYRISASTRAVNPDIDLFVGRDLNGNGIPEENEELCRSTSGGSNEDCDLTVAAGAASTNYWIMAQNWSGAGTGVTVDSYVIKLAAGEAQSLVATGPGNLPANAAFNLRLAWDDATMTDGTQRLGVLLVQPTPGNTAIEVPIRLNRSGTGFVPYGLAPGVARNVSLPAGTAHETLFFDVPPNATQVTFRTQDGSGSVSLYAARVATPAGPVIGNAPARNAPGVLSANAAGANQTLVVSGANLQPGRWYVTPVNTGAGVARVDVLATIDTVGAVPALKRGSYYNAARGGHGVFFYPSGPDYALLWYTYLQDGTPTWYYVQGAQPGSNGVFNGTIYRSAWNGDENHLVTVGNLLMTPSSANTFTMAYNLDGFTGAEPMQAFLTGCPSVGGNNLDVSTHWYDPARSGYGYSVQVAPSYEFHATFAYDGVGMPRFLVAERGGAFNTGGGALNLQQLSGFGPLAAYTAPTRTTIGTLTRTYGSNTIATMASNATFTGLLSGTWNEGGNMSALSGTQGCTP